MLPLPKAHVLHCSEVSCLYACVFDRSLTTQDPRKWLKKGLHLANVSLSLERSEHSAPAHDLPVPLLHIDEAEVSSCP